MIRGVTFVALLGAVALGCDKAPAPEARAVPPSLSVEAAAQVDRACGDYVAYVCAVASDAAGDAALVDECRLARTIPAALDLATRAAMQPQASAVDAEGVLANVGKIQKNCVEQTARLELRFPRSPAPAAPR